LSAFQLLWFVAGHAGRGGPRIAFSPSEALSD
jgi:hypothetical protein